MKLLYQITEQIFKNYFFKLNKLVVHNKYKYILMEYLWQLKQIQLHYSNSTL